MAARTGHVELHASAGLLDGSLALALRADSRLFDHSVAVAIRANVLTRDAQAHHAAADRRPERDVDLIFEITARLGTFLCLRKTATTTAAENSREDVAKSAATA